MADLKITFAVGPTRVRAFLAAACLCLLAVEVNPESVTLNTYYPAPSGIYVNMITTGNTYLARDGGNVGIGTTAPMARLDIKGNVRIDDGTQGAGKVLTSDANGIATWKQPSSISNLTPEYYTCPENGSWNFSVIPALGGKPWTFCVLSGLQGGGDHPRTFGVYYNSFSIPAGQGTAGGSYFSSGNWFFACWNGEAGTAYCYQ